MIEKITMNTKMTMNDAVKMIEKYGTFKNKNIKDIDELVSFMFQESVLDRLEGWIKYSPNGIGGKPWENGIVANSCWGNDRIGSNLTAAYIIKKGKTMTRITANAYVHPANVPVRSDEKSKYIVDVYGVEPHDYVRTYTIEAKHDKDASAEALRRFSNDITILLLSREET